MAYRQEKCSGDTTIDFDIHCEDCLDVLDDMDQVDAVITSPPYPYISREYGSWGDDWLDWMDTVMLKLRRVVKSSGSAIIVIEPNSEKVGKLRTWHYEFAIRMAKMWGIVQELYWIKTIVIPASGATQYGLTRSAVVWCLWLGNSDCYRDQKSIKWDASKSQLDLITKRAHLSNDLEYVPNGQSVRYKRFAEDRGGVTPMNVFPCATAGYNDHPACFPVKLIETFVKYISPPGGTVLDPFSGSGTTGVACLRNGRKYVGIELDPKYACESETRLEDETCRLICL